MMGRLLLVAAFMLAPGCYEDGAPPPPARSTEAISAYGAAHKALQAGDLDDALTHVAVAVAADPAFDEAQWLQASLLGRAGRLPEALEICGALTARSPDFAQAHLLQGILWEQSEKPDAAGRSYDAALQCFAERRATESLGRDDRLLEAVATFLRHGELEGVKAVNRYLRQFPDHPVALYVKACMQDKNRSFLLRWFSEGGGENRAVSEKTEERGDALSISEAPAHRTE